MDHSHVSVDVLLGICSAYLVIAVMFGLQAASKTGKAKRSLELLFAIFLLCAFSGYTPRILPIPELLQKISHWTLLGVSVWFIVTNRIGAITQLLEDKEQ